MFVLVIQESYPMAVPASIGTTTHDEAAAALAQIKAKGYHEKYLRAGKRLTLVSAAFDAEMRNLSDRRIEVAAQT